MLRNIFRKSHCKVKKENQAWGKLVYIRLTFGSEMPCIVCLTCPKINEANRPFIWSEKNCWLVSERRLMGRHLPLAEPPLTFSLDACWWMKDCHRLSLPLLLLFLTFFFWALVLPVCAGLVRLSAILFDALHPLLSVQCLESPVGKRKRSLAVSSSQDPSFSGLNQVWTHNHLLIIPQNYFSLRFVFPFLFILFLIITINVCWHQTRHTC